MTKTKSTKRALLLSALSLLMCVSMLIGSTFAWFTDSVTSTGNKIQAGTLKIDLELLEKDGTWTSIKDSKKAIFNYENWEPGYTDVKILRVTNEGTLALKWVAKFVSASELTALANVIDVYVNTTVSAYPQERSNLDGWQKVGTVAEFVNNISETTYGDLIAGESANLGIALKMQETAGNEYQGMDLGGAFDIQIFATQYTYEKDSFDELYDKDAPFIEVANTAELQAALDNAESGTVIKLASNVTYETVYLRATESNVTGVTCFPGVCGYTTSGVDAFKAHWANENTGGGGHVPHYTAAIKNVTIVGANGATVAGVQAFSGHASAGTTDAVLGTANTGSYYVALNISNLTFKDVAFTGQVNIESSHEDAVYDGVTFNGCSFTTGGTAETNGAAIRYYSEANNGKVKNIVVKDCAFNNCRQGVYTCHVNGVTVTGSTFDTLGHNAIAVQSHSSAAHGNVTITGNTFKNVENRVIRFNGVDAPTAITIQKNVATNSGDDDNEIMKATSIAVGVTTSIKNNNWGTGKVVANEQLKDRVDDGSVLVANTAELQAALDNAESGTVIKLASNVTYETVYLRATESNVTGVTCFPGVCGYTTSGVDAFKAHWANENTGGGGHVPHYTAAIKNVTIVGANGATVAGVQAFSGHASAGTTDAVLGTANTGSYYVALNISNLTFKDVAFTGQVNIESSHEDAVYDGVTFNGCSFTTGGTAETNGAAIRYYSEANNGKVKNIVVKDCAFNNCRQGVYTCHVNGVTVTGSTFDTLGHNAIAVQSHSSAAHGNVTITGNTFKNVENRVIRFNGVDAPTAITIQNNTATNCGDDANEVMKATSIASGVTTSISNNYWGTSGVVANDELEDK